MCVTMEATHAASAPENHLAGQPHVESVHPRTKPPDYRLRARKTPGRAFVDTDSGVTTILGFSTPANRAVRIVCHSHRDLRGRWKRRIPVLHDVMHENPTKVAWDAKQTNEMSLQLYRWRAFLRFSFCHKCIKTRARYAGVTHPSSDFQHPKTNSVLCSEAWSKISF